MVDGTLVGSMFAQQANSRQHADRDTVDEMNLVQPGRIFMKVQRTVATHARHQRKETRQCWSTAGNFSMWPARKAGIQRALILMVTNSSAAVG